MSGAGEEWWFEMPDCCKDFRPTLADMAVSRVLNALNRGRILKARGE